MTPGDAVIDAFLEAARDTLGTMAMLELDVQGVAPVARFDATRELTATMGLGGENEGLLVLSLDAPLARRAVSSMLGVGEEEVEDDLFDGVGELANMIAGAAKTALTGGPHHFELSIPACTSGAGRSLSALAGTTGFRVEGRVAGEPLDVAVWLRPRS